MQTTNQTAGSNELLPVRGADAVDILINDHGTIKSLLEQLTAAQDTTTRQAVLERLKAVLTIHNATEENLVYPALATVAGKKMKAAHLYHETAEADIVLFQLDTMLKEGDDDKFPALAKTFQAAILEHIDDEENSAFEKLRKHSEPRETELLAESVRKFRAELDVRVLA